ncbi:hypothetical protein QIA17_06545 (plasmid) [Borreliella californiensis]|uniref:Ribosomal protein S18 n=1 Tax=Borreliella californiensis TaxID=373543 RepID=A0A7W9ZMI8_9SPIR|nr:hypothetical protein [Borreliella californiensis]MBB6213890.1 ribosomal protein S18 [Borreliella californiensis]
MRYLLSLFFITIFLNIHANTKKYSSNSSLNKDQKYAYEYIKKFFKEMDYKNIKNSEYQNLFLFFPKYFKTCFEIDNSKNPKLLKKFYTDLYKVVKLIENSGLKELKSVLDEELYQSFNDGYCDFKLEAILEFFNTHIPTLHKKLKTEMSLNKEQKFAYNYLKNLLDIEEENTWRNKSSSSTWYRFHDLFDITKDTKSLQKFLDELYKTIHFVENSDINQLNKLKNYLNKQLNNSFWDFNIKDGIAKYLDQLSDIFNTDLPELYEKLKKDDEESKQNDENETN